MYVVGHDAPQNEGFSSRLKGLSLSTMPSIVISQLIHLKAEYIKEILSFTSFSKSTAEVS